MNISLRFKLFAAFALMAGVMGAVTVLSISALDRQVQASVAALTRQDRAVEAMATLGALPFQTQGLILAHLQARTQADKAGLAVELLAADTKEALAISTLAGLAQGAEGALVADLQLQAKQAADLRARLVSISSRNTLGEAVVLATQQMPSLRAEIIATLDDVAAQTGNALAVARAKAALNGVAAAQKNALLDPAPGYVTGQLAAAALARAEMADALSRLPADPVPAMVPLRDLMAELQALDDQMEVLVRDGGQDTAETIFQTQLRPLDRQRQEGLSGLARLMQTGRRAVEAAAQEAAADWRMTLVLMVDGALVLGFGLVMLGLSRLGRGLEAAVRLAEQIAEATGAPPTWVKGNLSGRLTAALVRISAGQSAVLASLEAAAAGRPPRQDMNEALRQKFGAILSQWAPQGGGARGREAAGLQETLRDAVADARTLQEGAGGLAAALSLQGAGAGLVPEAERHALIAERHLATLVLADRQALDLAQALAPHQSPLAPHHAPLAPNPSPLRRIA
ncbi:hypothetical protein NX862_07200 [Rhodobacter sp. KR11]|uniref:hypothetical protein n=1 Tax=Rhodobacter sp. KR11 TaxID=2974588 RepID=UPI002222CBDA|nr:hypothetical protein [Rhodobacter sp. KR11]MCW1918534.1 hypothetical protein [Rhodobacter sp. KR11]